VRIERIDHVQISIPVGDEAAARAFYCGVLGLREIEKPASLRARGGLWVEVGDQAVHLGTEPADTRRPGRAHVAYAVDDVDAWKRHLEAHGVEIGTSVPIPGIDRFEFRDPFGNRVEITSTTRDDAAAR
jgi:catechol 2,3-dioxygenase-like lactoylglutathione lyase family enzyme